MRAGGYEIGAMEIDEIKKLIELMEEKGVIELELKDRSGEVRLVRGVQSITQAAAAPVSHRGTAQTPAAGATNSDAPEQSETEPNLTITSPMVGTFYTGPNPEAAPFVAVGGMVEKGDVVCIIEAMKMMNEIEAELQGRVRRVLVENGQPVEYGQALFLLESA